jgi:hypothetical protein
MDGTLQYRTLFPVRNELFSDYTGPLSLADAVTVETRVVKPAAVVSEPLIILLERASPPELGIVDDEHIILTSTDPLARIELRELPDGPWTIYPEGSLLNRSSPRAARCWHPDKLTSLPIRLDNPYLGRSSESGPR